MSKCQGELRIDWSPATAIWLLRLVTGDVGTRLDV